MPDYRRQMGRRWTLARVRGASIWLAGDSQITLATGVSAWGDQIAPDDGCSQGTAGQQPTYGTSAAFGGKNVLTFTSAASKRLANSTYTGHGGLAGATLFLVAKSNAIGTTDLFSFATYSLALGLNGAGRLYAYCGSGSAFSGCAFSDTASAHVIELVYDGAGVGNAGRAKIWIDGAEQTMSFTANTIPATLPATTGYDVGSGGAGGYTNADVASLLFSTVALTAAERSRVRTTLAAYYGLTVAP